MLLVPHLGVAEQADDVGGGGEGEEGASEGGGHFGGRLVGVGGWVEGWGWGSWMSLKEGWALADCVGGRTTRISRAGGMEKWI